MTCVPAEPMSMPTRHQRDVVLDPDRVVLQPLVDVEIEMIVVVIGVAVVLVHEILAEQMVGQAMAGLGIVGVGHSKVLPARRGVRGPCAGLWHDRFATVKMPAHLSEIAWSDNGHASGFIDRARAGRHLAPPIRQRMDVIVTDSKTRTA